jgi:hypothetical protein
MYYVSIGIMSIVVNVVIRMLHELAIYLVMMWCGPGMSSEFAFVVVAFALNNMNVHNFEITPATSQYYI